MNEDKADGEFDLMDQSVDISYKEQQKIQKLLIEKQNQVQSQN